MDRSESIAQLAAALALAQAEIEGASKDRENPHFRSRYADLASCWEACRAPLTKHGLSVVQLPEANGATVQVTTVLLHKSGEFISSALAMTAQDAKPQSIGSALTYARRYGLSSVVGVAPEDDDGEAAMRPPMMPPVAQRPLSRPQAQTGAPPPRSGPPVAPKQQLKAPAEPPPLTDADIPF